MICVCMYTCFSVWEKKYICSQKIEARQKQNFVLISPAEKLLKNSSVQKRSLVREIFQPTFSEWINPEYTAPSKNTTEVTGLVSIYPT